MSTAPSALSATTTAAPRGLTERLFDTDNPLLSEEKRRQVEEAFFLFREAIRQGDRKISGIIADVFGTCAVNMQLAVKWQKEGSSVRLPMNLEQAAADLYLLILLEAYRRMNPEWDYIGEAGGYALYTYFDGTRAVFQATKVGEGKPEGDGGYYNIRSLLDRKGVKRL